MVCCILQIGTFLRVEDCDHAVFQCEKAARVWELITQLVIDQIVMLRVGNFKIRKEFEG